MGDLVKDITAKDETEAEARSVAQGSPLRDDGLTVHGNDPRDELHYQTELDPDRVLPGGIYLDRVNREKAELNRAVIEDRDPDLDNPGPYAGSPLRSAAQLNNPMNVVQAEQLSRAEPAMVLDPEIRESAEEDEPTDNDSSDPSDSGSGDVPNQGSGPEGVNPQNENVNNGGDVPQQRQGDNGTPVINLG